jgi:hypothetical protein
MVWSNHGSIDVISRNGVHVTKLTPPGSEWCNNPTRRRRFASEPPGDAGAPDASTSPSAPRLFPPRGDFTTAAFLMASCSVQSSAA